MENLNVWRYIFLIGFKTLLQKEKMIVLPQYFQKLFSAKVSESICMLERIKHNLLIRHNKTKLTV